MNTPHTIPLPVLIRAVAALKISKGLSVGEPLRHQDWITVMRAYNEMDSHLERLVKDQLVPLSTD